MRCFAFVDIMVNMGYSRKDVEESLAQNKYDDMTATYLLLGRRTAMVGLIVCLLTTSLMC